jgi:hypothetical protein
MKIFTHTYKITVFYNGKFCWKNQGWIEKQSFSINESDLMLVLAITYIIFS